MKLTYAYHSSDNSKLVNINDVVKGLNCNCLCPNCGSKLVARKGEIKAHHFAHYNTEECSGAYETMLHLLAKDVLTQNKEIVIPELLFYDEAQLENIILSKSRKIKFDTVEVEKKFKDIVPDLIIYVNNTPVFIEIAVTHYIDKEKLRKIKNYGISTLEVDLAELKENFTLKSLKRKLISSTENKNWVYSNKTEKLISKYRRKKRILEAQEQAWDRYHESLQDFKENQSKMKGYRQINMKDEGYFFCPKKLDPIIKRKKISHKILNMLKSLKSWDGEIHTTYGGANYICFSDEKKVYFSPNWKKKERLTKEEFKKTGIIYAILLEFSQKCCVDKSVCISCNYFDSFLVDGERISCKYPKIGF